MGKRIPTLKDLMKEYDACAIRDLDDLNAKVRSFIPRSKHRTCRYPYCTIDEVAVYFLNSLSQITKAKGETELENACEDIATSVVMMVEDSRRDYKEDTHVQKNRKRKPDKGQ